MMLDRILKNRCAILNVLTDQSITTQEIARKLENSETQWSLIEIIVNLLKPLYILTTVLCKENSPVSMVRLNKVIEITRL